MSLRAEISKRERLELYLYHIGLYRMHSSYLLILLDHPLETELQNNSKVIPIQQVPH